MVQTTHLNGHIPANASGFRRNDGFAVQSLISLYNFERSAFRPNIRFAFNSYEVIRLGAAGMHTQIMFIAAFIVRVRDRFKIFERMYRSRALITRWIDRPDQEH
ncbi:hypothetical protein D3C76_1680970 [compost metagenome]